MSGELRVTTAHVRELSARQGEAAAQIAAAAGPPQGTGARMWMNHGLICAGTNTSVLMAENVRGTACAAMAGVSTDLETKLTTAALRYDQVDSQGGSKLDGEVCVPG